MGMDIWHKNQEGVMTKYDLEDLIKKTDIDNGVFPDLDIDISTDTTFVDGPYQDLVNHPPHYKSATGLETIDVIEAFTSDLKGIEATDTGNIIKYICRWKNKNGLQDLQKAKWYLEHLINHVEKENKQ